MIFTNTIRLYLLISSLVLSLGTIIYAVTKGKRTQILRSYVWLQILLFIWLSAQIFRLFATSHAVEWAFVRYEYLAVCFISLSWLIFCLLYTENKFLKQRWKVLLLFIPPIIFYITVLTNDTHHLFFAINDQKFTRKAILFEFHTIISYIYCLTGMWLIMKYAIKQFGYTKIQSFLLIIAVSIPIVFNLVMITGVLDPGFDITPISFSLSFMFFIIATFKYKLLNIIPIALRKIVDNMNEAILVTDCYNHIIDVNSAFKVSFPDFNPLVEEQDIVVFLKILTENTDNAMEDLQIIEAIGDRYAINIAGELCITKPILKFFAISIQPIYNGNEVLGRVITFNDVTDYKKLLIEFNQKNSVLSDINRQLQEHAATVEELAIAKERNRVARDVHDTLGQTMTLLITLLQVSSIDCLKDPLKAQQKVNEAIRIAGEGLNEVRRSISGLVPQKLQEDNLLVALKQLIGEFEASGISIDFSLNGFCDYSNPMYSDTLYRVCQEALTNSLRHGKASQVTIILQLKPECIKLYIFDNGCGCKEIQKGMGISGMEERVKSLNGTIIYGSDGENGFNVHVEIPLEGMLSA